MENSRSCGFCNVKVHRASMQKHLRSKKQLEKGKQNGIIIAQWLFEEEQSPIRKKVEKIIQP